MPVYVRCANSSCSAARVGTKFDPSTNKDCPVCHGSLGAADLEDLARPVPETVGLTAGSIDTVPQAIVPASPWSPSVGSLFADRFTITRRLGRGGMGAVYLAHDEKLDRDVAVKIPDGVGFDDSYLKRFQREARAAAQLGDVPTICHIVDVGEFKRVPFLIMDYVPGQTLGEVLQQQRGGLDVARASRIVEVIAQALQVAHQRGIIHRDLKPANVMIRDDDTPVVMDFGLARRDGEEQLTQTGDVMGTLAYMSPEQTRGEIQAVTATSDVHSLGVILYELLTGRRPFSGSQRDVVRQIWNEMPAAPSTVRPGLDPRLDAICLKAMAKRPEDRFASMAAFASALANLARAEPSPPAPPLPTHAPRPPRLGLVLATLLVLIVAAGSAYLIYANRVGGEVRQVRGSTEGKITEVILTPEGPPTVPLPNRTSKSTGMLFAYIAPGRFEMGTALGDGDDAEEQPRHPVEISRGFLLGEHEVTQEEYAKEKGRNPSTFQGDGRKPVEGVSWFDAVAFCNALSKKDGLPPFYKIDGEKVAILDPSGIGYRLPTEAEWEYACRAGRSGKFGFGDTDADAAEHAWYHANSKVGDDLSTTHPVAGKTKNPWGLHDMQGNVWEWCWDRHAEQYEPGLAKDPTGPLEGEQRVLRGGAYNSKALVLRCAVRHHAAPGDSQIPLFGFRVARTYR